MAVELEPRSEKRRDFLAAAGAIALIPVVLGLGGLAGLGVPAALVSPIVILGCVAFALLVNVGAAIRWRWRRTADLAEIECDLRLRYRGANRTVTLVALVLGATIALYVVAVNFGPH
jgi:hypothetical protein